MTNSARTEGRISRLLAMLPWVIAHPGTPTDEVCRRFGYTRGQLVKDLNTVFVCGLPGYGPGDLMDASIDDYEVTVEMADYVERPLRLQPGEVFGILAAAKAVQSAGFADDSLRRAIGKVEATLIPESPEAVVVDLPDPPFVKELRDAANEGAVVRIDHTSIASGIRKVRDIEPWAVFTTLGNWYVSGYCRSAGDERVFRIDRIRSVEPTGERFIPVPGTVATTIRYTPGDDDTHAVIRLTADARWVAEYYPVDILDDGPGGLTVRMSSSDPALIARLLVRLGADAELVEGDDVAAATNHLRARILERYAGTAHVTRAK